MKRSLHIVRGLDPRSGGTSVSVPALVQAVSETGRFEQHLLYFAKEGDYVPQAPGVELLRFDWSPRGAFLGRFDGARSLAKAIYRADVVHIHGVWESHCAAAGFICREMQKPFVVSAHGMLERWALRNKRWKKWLYSTLVERRNLRGAACLRALTRQEVGDYRRFGLAAPAALIPNGIAIPETMDSAPFYRRFPELLGKRLVLFLSRVHHKKGVDILCRAWAALSQEFPDARLVIAGPDFEGTLSRVETLTRKLGLQNSVTFTGMLGVEDKWAALAAAETFVLPSHSEGFSVAVLEALAAARPVIITPGCNFPEVEEARCGVISLPTDRQIEDAVRDMLRRTPEERAAMGARGAALVRTRFTWPEIGCELASVYDWLLGAGPMPQSVSLAADLAAPEAKCTV
ncbi:MAG TPA: glycosyltransferase [Bryobacteraceae bacterium]|nr:glycosyltransferase [Bryobacteraceae bacterium]